MRTSDKVNDPYVSYGKHSSLEAVGDAINRAYDAQRARFMAVLNGRQEHREWPDLQPPVDDKRKKAYNKR